MEWARDHSGVAKEPLDEGERKLQAQDVSYVRGQFSRSQAIHFHCFGRLGRIWPRGERWYRRIDYLGLRVPLGWKFAGQVLIAGRKG